MADTPGYLITVYPKGGPGLSPNAAMTWLNGAIREHSRARDNGAMEGDLPAHEYHRGYVRGLDDGRRMLRNVLNRLGIYANPEGVYPE